MPLHRTVGAVLRRAGKVAEVVTDPKTIALITAGYVTARALVPVATGVLERRVISRISHNVPNPLPAQQLYGKQYHGRPLRLLIIGDSLAAGATAIDPEIQEWPEAILPGAIAERLARRLKRPVELFAMAEVGDKHQGLNDQLQWAATEIKTRERSSFVQPKVDLALVIAGSNDVRDGNYKAVDLVDSALRNCVVKLHTKFGKPAIMLVECPLLTTAPATDNNLVRLGLNPRAQEIRAVQRRVVKDFQEYENERVNLKLVEVDDITAGLRAEDGMFVTYDIHPTGPGQHYFAEQLVNGKLGEMADGIRSFSGTHRRTVAQRARHVREQRNLSNAGYHGKAPRRLANGGGVSRRVAGHPRNPASRSRSAGS